MINPTSSSDPLHFPVMLDEVIKICSPEKGGIYIDCTFGGGGYSKRLLKFSKTKVIALDRDKFIFSISKELVKKHQNRFFFQLFTNIKNKFITIQSYNFCFGKFK